MGYRSGFPNLFRIICLISKSITHKTWNVIFFILYYDLLDFFKKEVNILYKRFNKAKNLLFGNHWYRSPNTCRYTWRASVHRHTIRFTCWLYDSGVRYAFVFRLGLTYTHKHSPGLPSSFSDLMPPTVPAPAVSTVSAGASSHSKKIQLNLQHTNTQIHGSLLQLPARSSLTGY